MVISFLSFETPPCDTARPYSVQKTHPSSDLSPEGFDQLEQPESSVDDKTRLLFWLGLHSTAGSIASPVDEDWTKPMPGQTIYPHLIPPELPRPEFGGINPELLNAVFPDLAENNIEYIEEQVSLLRPKLITSLSSLSVETIHMPNTLYGRKEMTVNINQNTEILPSHVLAICQPIMKTEGNFSTLKPGPVALYPIHALVFALECTEFPIPPPSIPGPGPDLNNDSDEPQQVTLPIMAISIPSPETFPLLIDYLYTKHILHLYGKLFPPLKPQRPRLEGESKMSYANDLDFTMDTGVIIKYMQLMNGFWKNLIALGVFDQELWYAIEGVWLVLVEALKDALGSPEIITLTELTPRPKPLFFVGNEFI